jgi:hypothetical protein
MLPVMLSQQVLAVVIAIRCSYYGMNMLAPWLSPFQLPHGYRKLVIELDQYHRTVDAVVKNAIGLSRAAAPHPS